MKSIYQLVDEIKNDHSHGASYLSVQSMRVMQQLTMINEFNSIQQFLAATNDVARLLANCRPSMVSINNLISGYIDELNQHTASMSELEELRLYARTCCESLINDFMAAGSQAIENAAALIGSGDTIVSCSYSSTIYQTLVQARRQNKDFGVILARSRSEGSNLAYGEMLATELQSAGLESHIIEDDVLPEGAAQATMVLVGADSIRSDGSLVNGYPSLKLAGAARKLNIPFYSICDNWKFDRRHPVQEIEEPGFDLIPVEFISGIITEKGVIPGTQL